MIYHVYAIRDRLTGFMTPSIESSDPVAMRSFEMVCSSHNSEKYVTAFKPSDFSLYRIADYDTDTGELIPTFPPVTVCSGDSFKEV